GTLTGVRTLVLGASGFIGRWCADQLAAAGAEIVTAARTTPSDATGVIAFDASRPGEAAELIARTRPHFVVNAVGYGVGRQERQEEMLQRLNADFPEEVAEALAGTDELPAWPGPRLLHLGSAFEYGSVAGAVSEETPCRPGSAYARTKLEGTRRVSAVAARTGLRATTVRVATVYGPGEHPHRLLPSLIRTVQTGETLELTAGEQERDFTYVGDVAHGLVRLAMTTDPLPPVLNLATGRLHTVRAFAEAAMRELGIPGDRVIFGAIPYRDDEVRQGPIVVDRLRAAVDWVPGMTLAEGIRKTVDQLRERP
ncbi:MAG TPA: NAD(P)-dependent oxidoreductase, partial [Gemmatimonadales bacterium]|nr:NAD(P)-dependent oxidoreductase [Gemmatimonadales bacterium]